MSRPISNLLRPGFCFRSLEELKDLGKTKLTPKIEQVSRIALTLFVPLAIVADVVMTTLGVLTIIPLCYHGSKLLKQAGSSWMLLVGTPIFMLLYLCKERIFNPASVPQFSMKERTSAPPLILGEPGGLIGDWSLLTFPPPAGYLDTRLHRYIVSDNWVQVRNELHCKKARGENLQERFYVTWNDQSLSVTLLDFMMLATVAKTGIHSYARHELTQCLSEFGSWQASSFLSDMVRDAFVIILLRSMIKGSYMSDDLCHKQLSIIQGLQGNSANNFHEIFLELLEEVNKKREKCYLCDNLKKNQIKFYRQVLSEPLNELMPSVLSGIVIGYVCTERVIQESETVVNNQK